MGALDLLQAAPCNPAVNFAAAKLDTQNRAIGACGRHRMNSDAWSAAGVYWERRVAEAAGLVDREYAVGLLSKRSGRRRSRRLTRGGHRFAIWAPAAAQSHLKQDSARCRRELLKAAAPPRRPEGLFAPETYVFDPGTSDIDIYRQAYRAQTKLLQDAWAARKPDLPYASPYAALTMASIIEKETGQASERAMIAGVFVNRLKQGMLLQTDPSVIYGIGPSFDGNLRKRDLLADGPYNSYTRAGLPPTPIALPGRASIEAALNPANTSALYFVSRGDGTSHFSTTLAEHNRAVDAYQRCCRR